MHILFRSAREQVYVVQTIESTDCFDIIPMQAYQLDSRENHLIGMAVEYGVYQNISRGSG
ncbi:MAG TPA: hypothetical protein VGU63_13130 [Candidatus Acidoferrales bacterium]|nr:hypothetical protein [Candidatus Acidoferrales bacterium]